MTTLYLHRGDLSLSGNRLAIYADGRLEGTLPLHLPERVVLRRAVARMEPGATGKLRPPGFRFAASMPTATLAAPGVIRVPFEIGAAFPLRCIRATSLARRFTDGACSVRAVGGGR